MLSERLTRLARPQTEAAIKMAPDVDRANARLVLESSLKHPESREGRARTSHTGEYPDLKSPGEMLVPPVVRTQYLDPVELARFVRRLESPQSIYTIPSATAVSVQFSLERAVHAVAALALRLSLEPFQGLGAG